MAKRYDSEIDLRRDEPPSQIDLDKATFKKGCPACGKKGIGNFGYAGTWMDCHNCGELFEREVC